MITETAEGAWADLVIRGDPSLKPACIAAAQRLVERGAVAISSNCGFFIRHQAEVAASVNVPVAMSSLLLATTLLRQLAPTAKLAVVTADSRHCGDDLLGVANLTERSRVIIAGIEGGDWFQNVMKHWSRNETNLPPPPIKDTDLETDVAACVARLRAAHPEIAALLLECTGFPVITPSIRRITGLPVYDITSLCRITIESVS
ncbi:hypothetical protein J2R96_001975 [Bradyrhizobium elkanii]|nr:hypothetical protein [Bradyrhizobium elkanii]